MLREQMKKERKEAYVEVLEVLKHMESKYVEKVPIKLREFLMKSASKEYKFTLDKTIPFEEQELKETTINILAMINYNYWCEDEEHKRYLLNKYNENEIKYQEMLMEKYSTDNLFKKERKTILVSNKENINNFPQHYEEPKWYVILYENIYEFVSKFIRKLFN